MIVYVLLWVSMFYYECMCSIMTVCVVLWLSMFYCEYLCSIMNVYVLYKCLYKCSTLMVYVLLWVCMFFMSVYVLLFVSELSSCDYQNVNKRLTMFFLVFVAFSFIHVAKPSLYYETFMLHNFHVTRPSRYTTFMYLELHITQPSCYTTFT